MRLVTWRRAAMRHGPFNETSDLATEEEILIWLTNEQLPKLIVQIRSNTERGEITKPTYHRDLDKIVLNGLNTFTRLCHRTHVAVHGVNVHGSSRNLSNHGNDKGGRDFSEVTVHSVFLNEVVPCLGSNVEGGNHGDTVTHSKHANSAKGGALRLVVVCSTKLASKDGVSPRQKTDIGNRGISHLDLFSFLFLADLVRVEHELTKVRSSKSSTIHNSSQAEREPTEEGLRLGKHLSSWQSREPA